MMTADRVQVQQVIMNLLLNASDAVAESERQTVTIGARQDGGKLIVTVADTGPGVSVEAAANLFSWAASAKTDGMGLGLSICRTIVEAHGGRIWLENSSENGAEFRFSIPLP